VSAWIVSASHIDVLVHGLIRKALVDDQTPSELGQELWEENHKSIRARYGDEAPTPKYEYVAPDVDISDDNLGVAAGCYIYQSCEHAGWESSRANRLVSQLDRVPDAPVEHKAPINLAVASPWGFEDAHVHPEGRRP